MGSGEVKRGQLFARKHDWGACDHIPGGHVGTWACVEAISSFSKNLAPSLRLGWIQANPKYLEILKHCGQLDSSGGVNPFISRKVHNIISNGDMERARR